MGQVERAAWEGDEMTKKKLAILEKCFAADIQSAMTGSPRLCQMRSSKAIRELIDDGMIQPLDVIFRGVRISGYVLTQRGHMTYCLSCKE